MRFSVASAALAAAFVLTPLAAGYAPALSQDFSITNKEAPVDPSRRDLMRQLQAWWDMDAYYPKEASQSDVGGTVKVHLVIHPDGNIWQVYVEESSGSRSIDAAAFSAFHGGFVRPFPEGANAPQVELDISLHYVLAHRHDEPVAAGYTQVASQRPFTITNDPVKSGVVDTMLQRTCTGEVRRGGLRNHPMYGWRNTATAIFFRKPDGTPWVKFREVGFAGGTPETALGSLVVASVTEQGNVAKWTGQIEWRPKGESTYATFTVWPDGDNRLIGDLDHPRGTVELTCATEIVPAITSTAWLEFPEAKFAPEPEALHYKPGTIPPSFKNP
jgi:TonB family protein